MRLDPGHRPAYTTIDAWQVTDKQIAKESGFRRVTCKMAIVIVKVALDSISLAGRRL